MADDRLLQNILARLGKLEESTVRLRVGEITQSDPLHVQLGGALDEAGDPAVYTDVSVIGHRFGGAKVAALMAGKKLVVLGQVGHGMTSNVVQVFGNGSSQTDVIIDHNLGVTPRVILTTAGENTNAGISVGVVNKNSDTFQLRLRHIDDVGWSAGVSVYWLAIGE